MTRPTVLVVDDDPLMLEWLVGALADDYQVAPYASADAALGASLPTPPDAVVSDIVMPGIGGFEFRRRFVARYAEPPPFVFLSSVADPETTVAALESGADDFIQKPTRPEVLRARVAVALRRARSAARRLTGDLAQTRFVDLLSFCEGQHFTGTLVVQARDLEARLTVRGGHLDPDQGAAWLDRLCALGEGRFELQPSALNLDDLAPSSSRPAGRVSAVRIRGRALEVQTELLDGSPPAVVSVVLAGHEVVAKTKRAVPEGARGPLLQRHVDALHEETLANMHDRVTALRRQQAGTDDGPASRSVEVTPAIAAPGLAPAAPPSTDGATLFDEGLDSSRRGDWAGALVCWEKALLADPDNKSLLINIKVARRKIDAR